MAQSNKRDALICYLQLLRDGTPPLEAQITTAERHGMQPKSVLTYIAELRSGRYYIADLPDDLINVVERSGARLSTIAPQYDPSTQDIWRRQAAANELQILDAQSARRIKIEFDDMRPIAIAWISDHHFDDPRARLDLAETDAVAIRDTEGMYLASGGDELNWYIKQLPKFPKFDDHAIPVQERMRLFEYWMEWVADKVLFACAGNHNYYFYAQAGFLFERWMFQKHEVHYSKDHIVPELRVGDVTYLGYASHENWGTSRLNPFHELIRAVRHAVPGIKPDFVLSGHRHDGLTAVAPIDGQPCTFAKSGSYKANAPDFEGQAHISESIDTMPALIFYPDEKRILPISSIPLAARILEAERKHYAPKPRQRPRKAA